MFTWVFLATAGCSINPVPPARSGATWDRYELTQGSAPNAFDSPRGRFTLVSNVRSSLQLLSSSFRVRVDVGVESEAGDAQVRCEHQPDGSYRCDSPLLSLHLRDGCTWGEVETPVGDATLEPWFVHKDATTADPWATGSTHVGFILRRGDRKLAAFDNDHQWLRPIWVDSEVSKDELLAIDALGAILDHLVAMGTEFVGPSLRPFFCGPLVQARRFPR
jgi:hypothetical protein